ncbi:hypothetical protein M1O51_03990 [Dehalococcoidia bacterium]|nr:hypothetical protein [Dehalococcoidia bacterium]
MKVKSSSLKKASKPANIKATLNPTNKDTVEIYSEKAGRNIEVTINPMLTEKERLKRIIGLSNSVTTG